MAQAERIVIALSKGKLAALTAGAALFVIGGFWMLNESAGELVPFWIFRSAASIHGLGLASIIFFGLAMAVGVVKLVDQSPGLVLDAKGLTDNSSAFSAGFIPWGEITGVEERRIGNQRILYVLLKSPEAFVTTFSPWKRKLLKASLLLGPSPVAISANALSVGFDQLLDTVKTYVRMIHEGDGLSQ